MKRIVRVTLAIVALMLVSGRGYAQQSQTYLVADFDEYDIEKALELCQKGGIGLLVHQHPFAYYGDYEWNNHFASDSRAVARMVRKAANVGVQLGVMARTDALSPEAVSASEVMHLRRSGSLELFDDLDAQDKDIAVKRTDLLKNPSSLNLILVDNELISYSTMELSGEIILLHRCTRGAFGSEITSHSIDAPTYKIWDSPDRLLAPDDMLSNEMKANLQKQLEVSGISFVLYEGDKGQEMVDESMRVRQAERWAGDEEPKEGTSLGWFSIHAADKKRTSTTVEDLEWMLSKAIGHQACFGLLIDERAMKHHGGLDQMLSVMKLWRRLDDAGVFTEAQRARMRDPYANWHIETMSDSLYLLFPMNTSRQYRCTFKESEPGLYTTDPMTWVSTSESRFGLQLVCVGKEPVKNPMVGTEKSLIMFPCTLNHGQRLVYNFNEVAYLTDLNYNVIKEMTPEGTSILPEGSSEVRVMCEGGRKRQPELIVRYQVREKPEMLNLAAADKPLYAPRVLIVLYDGEVGKEPLKYAINEYGAEVLYEYNILKGFAIRIPADDNIEDAIKYFREVEGVISVEKDKMLHLD
ncbi:MAG: hypothetical protein J6W26_07855 [Bacteroidales bacterium]|nr:hypothetical protein [Bacteroidales bacterium]